MPAARLDGVPVLQIRSQAVSSILTRPLVLQLIHLQQLIPPLLCDTTCE